MNIDILMPSLSPTMEEGTIIKWIKKEGDKVVSGDIIAEIETDKAIMDLEVIDSGKISRIIVPEGTSGVKVNTCIAILIQDNKCKINKNTINNIEDKKNNLPIIDNKQSIKSLTYNNFSEKDFIFEDFDISNLKIEKLTVREALRDAIAEEMRIDKNVFLMGEEVGNYQGAYKVSQGLLKEFGNKRIVDTPITEHAFAGIGIGAAFSGLRPIIEFMTFNFSMQAIDQIINSAAKTRYMSGGQISVPIVFRGPNGSAPRVAAQHSQCYASWYSHIPGLKVISPYTAIDAKGLMKSAIRDNNPIIFLENELCYGYYFEIPKIKDLYLPIGKARICKLGKDVTIVSFSIGMKYAVKAVSELLNIGIDVELIDIRTIRPMDIKTIIESVKKTGALITVEEGFPQSSVGTEIATRVMEQAFDWLDAPVITISGKDVPMPYAENLEKLALPTVEEIIYAVKSVTYKL